MTTRYFYWLPTGITALIPNRPDPPHRLWQFSLQVLPYFYFYFYFYFDFDSPFLPSNI